MEFTELNLHPDLQRGLADSDYVTCMAVQEQVLKNAFGGSDLYVQSQTGTGKTAAYLVAIFQRLLTEPLLGGKKALIMVPTRELAVQVEDEAKKIGKYLPFKVGSFYGGVGYAHQQKLLRENAQIMVGTPGRVLDLNGSGQMNLMDIAFLVLDEADRMFDMGFYPDLRKLIKVVPPADRRQTMLFSATLNAWVKNLAWEYTKEPLEIEIAPENITVLEIDQMLYHVPSEDKLKFMLGLFEREKPESAIIFCNTKRFTEIIAKRMRMNGIECEFIIGDLPQIKRLQVIEDVKAGKSRFLVATDVAARGLDIEGLAMVVNFDLPTEAENYVHRIGRTARAGKTGKAVSLASEQDVYYLPSIEKYLERKIPSEVAQASMYGTDKSEGLRIRTDDYGDDRGGGRGGRRDGRSIEGHGSFGGERGGRRSEHARPAERRNEAVSGQDIRRNPERAAPAGVARPFVPKPDALPPTERPRPVDRPPRDARIEREREKARTADRERMETRTTQGPRDNRAAAKPDLSRVSLEERLAYYKRKYGDDQSSPPQAAEAREGPRPKGRAPGPNAKPGRGQRRDATQPPAQKGPAQKAPAQKAPADGPKKSIIARLFGAFGKKK